MFDNLITCLGFVWNDTNLLSVALTHSSYANPRGIESNERLEYLGDSVIDLAVATSLMNRYPKWNEGQLSQQRAKLVCTDALANIALKIGIPLYIRVKSEYLRGIKKVNADALEAIIGAAYIDSKHNVDRVTNIMTKIGILYYE